MRRWVFLGLPAALLVLVSAAAAGPDQTHTGALATEHFEIRYRPGSRAGAAAEREGALAERDLARICKLLEIPNDGRYRLFLYDSAAELGAINELTGVGAFASGKDVHAPYGDDQTRPHEIAHVVTARLPRSGDEPRNMFFPDGISNALLQFVHGVPVHAVARFHRMGKTLPSLAEMTGAKDFYAWLRKRPGFNGYDVAASWFRYLLDIHGASAVKRYYTGTSPEAAFGSDLATLERAWHAHLDGYDLRPEVESLLRQRAGEDVRFTQFEQEPFKRLPAALQGKPSDWRDLTAAKLGKGSADAWKREKGVLRGATKSYQWSWCEFAGREVRDGAILAVLEPAPGCVGVSLRLGDGPRALLTNTGAFLYAGDVQKGATNRVKLAGGRTLLLVMVRRGDRGAIWVDGEKVLEVDVGPTAGKPGLGIAGGSVVVRSVKTRRLRR